MIATHWDCTFVHIALELDRYCTDHQFVPMCCRHCTYCSGVVHIGSRVVTGGCKHPVCVLCMLSQQTAVERTMSVEGKWEVVVMHLADLLLHGSSLCFPALKFLSLLCV